MAVIGGTTPGATGAYQQGLAGLQALAAASGGGTAASRPGAPATTPNAAPVEGFDLSMPTKIDPNLVNLIKQSFGTMTGDIASSAITEARRRGYAGDAGLLQTAAAPVAGQALAQVPAAESKALLDMMLNAYVAKNNAAAQYNAANAGALNAATNALMPGVNAYGHEVTAYGNELNAGNQRIANTTSLMNALMAPQNQMIAANLGLINALPHGTTNNTLSGGTTNQTLSGVTSGSNMGTQVGGGSSNTGSQTASNQTNTGNTTGTVTQPIGNVIGTGIGNIVGGGAAGYASATAPTLMNILQGRA